MNKDKIYELIKNKNIWYEITEHQAVYNMQELAQIKVPYPERDAKNLFIRDDKKRNYYLITVKGDKKVDLKEFRKKNNRGRKICCSNYGWWSGNKAGIRCSKRYF